MFEIIAKDRIVRQGVTRESHLMFFNVYFPTYVKYPFADFHKEIFRITEDAANKLACIVAFRGSGKSTLITFSYALWAILGIQQKKFVLIICQTQAQARQHMANLKYELEHNTLLKSDLGPFREEVSSGDWAISSLVFQNTGARVMIASVDQSIRGIRHHEHRPDLILLDDIEDINSTKTFEGRNKTFDWFTREVIPLGDLGTRTIIVGNLLHEDSLVMRLRKKIDAGEVPGGSYKWFPLLDENGACLWPGKFDTKEKIEALRLGVANEYAWQQEYLLRIVPSEEQVVPREWIQYYDELPQTGLATHGVHIGVDLAISQKETADYTSIVSGLIHGKDDEWCLYILPNIVNRRMRFPETVEQIKAVYAANRTISDNVQLLIEDIGYQRAVIDQLEQEDVWAEGVKVLGDKRSRLISVSGMIQRGKIKFPRYGAEDLVRQIVGFGIESHDDLVDAFTIVAHQAIELDFSMPEVIAL